MSTEVLSTEKNIATIKFTVGGEDFRKATNEAYQKNKKHYNVQGFRKGKAPRKIIEVYYGKVFYEDALESCFPKAYREAIKELALDDISRPVLDNVDDVSDDGAVYTVKVAIRPEVKLGDYKGAEIESLEASVEDADIDEAIKKMQEQNARMVTVDDTEAKEGDTVNIDYKGFVGEEAFEGGEAQGHALELGSGSFIPGFEEQLVGTKTGDHVEVKVTFPAEYHSEELAGKEAIFQVDVNEVQQKELPELDDEFAKDVSEFDTLEELRTDSAAKLKEEKEKALRNQAEQAVIEFAVNNAEVDVPALVVDDEVDNSIEDIKGQLSQMGMSIEQYAQFTGTDVNGMRENMRPNAEKNVKTDFVLGAIAKEEAMEVTDEEMEDDLKMFASSYGQDLETFKKNVLNDAMKDYIATGVKRRKVIAMLVDAAKVK